MESVEKKFFKKLPYFIKPEEVAEHFAENDTLTQIEIRKLLEEPNWGRISSSPEITEDFILKYIDKPWCWETLCCNPILTPEFVREFWDKIKDKWEWNYLTLSPHVDIDMVLGEPDYLPDMEWEIGQLHRNPNITPSIIDEYNLDWNWEYMYECPNLTIPFIEEHISELCHPRIIPGMKKLEGFDLDFIRRNIDYFFWGGYDLSEHFGLEQDEFDNLILEWDGKSRMDHYPGWTGW